MLVLAPIKQTRETRESDSKQIVAAKHVSDKHGEKTGSKRRGSAKKWEEETGNTPILAARVRETNSG